MSTTTPEAVAGRPSDPDAEERFWEAVRLELEEAKHPDPAAMAAEARAMAAERGWLCIDTDHPAIRGACRRLDIGTTESTSWRISSARTTNARSIARE